MKQMTLATAGFERYGKTTRRAVFLAEMERVVPWSALCGLIEPVYPKPGNGRPPVGVERMLRIYFLQHWFNLSDPAVEEALYDSLAMRRFVEIDLGREPVPDETTVCRFRHLLEQHDLGRQLFDEVQRHLTAKGLNIATCTIVDATIINAPSSTKNTAKARDPEMHQTKKGNQWYFGIKAHLGGDSRTKLIHAVVATPANAADSSVLPDLLHGKETRVGPTRTRRLNGADLVDRNFTADRPNQLWVADITYVPTVAGFLYLAVVLDAFSRRIVGWAMETHLRTKLVLAALEMAIGQRMPSNVIHHSDQGTQYTSLTFGGRCREADVRPSMGSVGDASTTPCATGSSPHWNASCWLVAASHRRRRPGWRSGSNDNAHFLCHAPDNSTTGLLNSMFASVH